ncbi:MAG: GNAT family N-acetyltransferase [Hyphomicrobiales bacterium]|nr:GNAT family N-acetyltransferase [Hyphomicrobiales bacterium]
MVHRDFATIEAAWRRFETHAVMSPYQRFDFLQAWHDHLGRPHGISPLLIEGRYGSKTGFIWPMGISTRGPLRVAVWLGGRYTNYNLGLYDAAAMQRLTRADIDMVLAEAAEVVGRIDALALINQPEGWGERMNPFLTLPHQPSPSFAYSLTLDTDFEEILARRRHARARKKMRWQNRKLAEFGGYESEQIADAAEAHRVLDIFFEQKNARFAQLGIPNSLDEPGARAFFHDLIDRRAKTGIPLLDLAVLRVAGKIRAIYGGGSANGRYSCYFNSIRMDEMVRFSPGELLQNDVIKTCCATGLDSFDLGIGEAQYKTAMCENTDVLFDSFHPLTRLGRAYCAIEAPAHRLKRSVKQNKRTWEAVKKLRRIRLAIAGKAAADLPPDSQTD